MIRNRPGPLVDYVPLGSGNIAKAAQSDPDGPEKKQSIPKAIPENPGSQKTPEAEAAKDRKDAEGKAETEKSENGKAEDGKEHSGPARLKQPAMDDTDFDSLPDGLEESGEQTVPGQGIHTPQSAETRTTIVSPEGALSFLFAIFALLMGFMAILENVNQATLLSVGVTWLILSLGALIASLINMIRGSDKGNTNLLATVLLGIFPGINTLITLDALVNGVPYKPVIVGLLYVVGAILCFGAACTRRTEPFYIFLRTCVVACGLFLVGFGDMISSHFILAAGGVFLFLYSLLSIYYGLSVLYPSYGYSLPQGRTFQAFLDERCGRRQKAEAARAIKGGHGQARKNPETIKPDKKKGSDQQ